MQNPNSSTKPWVSVSDLASIRARAQDVVEKNHVAAFAPFVPKDPPTFTAGQVAELCGIDRSTFEYRRTKNDLPDGKEADNRRRIFTVKEALPWVAEYRGANTRKGFRSGPVLPAAVVITVGSTSKGSGKSTTAATLAQGLNLRGHKVLLIDTDPQGTLTSMMGVNRDSLEDEDTILDFVAGRAESLADAIEPTYWSGIHLVGSTPRISAAEGFLKQMEKDGQPYWDAMSRGINGTIRSQYDAIIIDVESTLSSLLISSFFAADILILPVPTTPIGFAASLTNFNLITALNEDFVSAHGLNKGYNFVNILPFRQAEDATATQVREWLADAYGKHVLPLEIPFIASPKIELSKLGTAYDATYSQELAPVKIYRQAFDAYMRLADVIEGQMQRVWKAQVGAR